MASEVLDNSQATEIQPRSGAVREAPRRIKYNYRLSAKDDDYILKAIEEHKTLAFMAQQIGCCRQALAEYIHKDPVLQQAFTDAKDGMDDLAELRLYEKINQGDLGAIMFYMPRKMRHRGYGDEPVADQSADVPRVVIGKISDEELKEAELALAEIPALEVVAEDEPKTDTSETGEEPGLKAGKETVAREEEVADADGDADYGDDEIADPLFG